MRLHAYMVVKNEADRYLEESILSLRGQVDNLCVLDDRSTDDTAIILKKLGVPFTINGGQSFIDNESSIREQAWHFMEVLFEPRPGDWVLTLDADEILRSAVPLKDLCRQHHIDDGVWFPIREMWTPTGMRVDGWWGMIRGLRMAKYKPNGTFTAKRMGGGSLPNYVEITRETQRADILHYGYTRPEDRQAKFERYSKLTGHSPQHINSILQPATLAQLPSLI